MKGVEQLDLLDAANTIVLARSDAGALESPGRRAAVSGRGSGRSAWVQAEVRPSAVRVCSRAVRRDRTRLRNFGLRQVGTSNEDSGTSEPRNRAVALVLFLAARSGAAPARRHRVQRWVCSETVGPPAIALDQSDGKAAIVVSSVPAAGSREAARADMTREQWTEVLRVSVGEGQPAMLRRLRRRRRHACASRRCFRSIPGRQYHVVCSSQRRTASSRHGRACRRRPAVRRPWSRRSIRSSDVVPENQLRLYIHFSAPMGLKGGLDYITLVDEKGATVDRSVSAARHRVLERRSHALHGVLRSGPAEARHPAEPADGPLARARPTLHARRRSRVARRPRAAAQGIVPREFRVGPADERPLDITSWRVAPPAAGTRDPLVVTFPEALDHGLLLRALGVARDGQALAGRDRDRARTRRVGASRRGTPWRAGSYQLVAFGMLEDLAGNRIGRAFEVDQFDRADRSPEPERTAIDFRVAVR